MEDATERGRADAEADVGAAPRPQRERRRAGARGRSRQTRYLAELRATVALMLVAAVVVLGYLLSTPTGPNRTVLVTFTLAVIAAGVVSGFTRYATARFATVSRRGPGGLATLVFVVGVATVWIALDGGTSSPLNATLLLPLGLSIAAAPRTAVVVVVLVSGGHLLGTAFGGAVDVPSSLIWISQFALAGRAVWWVSHARDQHRAQLRTLSAELEDLATRDPLTRTLNRRGLESATTLLTGGADGRPTAVLVADLDHFKQVNDRFGHAVGDEVLIATARAITGAVRDGDLVARTGGEEFAVVLLDADRAEAVAVAERIRHAVGRASTVGDVTVSVGVATADDHGSDVPQLHQVADEAMYRAKRGGRDQVVLAPTRPGSREVAVPPRPHG